MKRIFVLAFLAVLLSFCFIGTTYAWLMAQSNTVSSCFTAGNISISLYERTSANQTMIPGATLTEDPYIVVRANSEDCWLFVHVHESAEFNTYLSYGINDAWTLVPGEFDTYYIKVPFSDSDQEFHILKNKEIIVNSDVTKAEYDAIDAQHYPTLEFIAYAIQQVGYDTPEAAWEEAEKLDQT